MTTLRIQINEKVLDKVLWLLGHFSIEEVEIVQEDVEFLRVKEEVHQRLMLMDKGEAEFQSIDELNNQLDTLISRYEN